MYAYVENGEIKRVGNLPKVWTMKDGSTVSGFHLLDKSVVLSEGWLPVEEIIPEYDEATECLTSPRYEIFADKVIKTYTVEPIQIAEPEINAPSTQEEIETLKQAIAELTILMTGGVM